jgi:hypothetical protein
MDYRFLRIFGFNHIEAKVYHQVMRFITLEEFLATSWRNSIFSSEDFAGVEIKKTREGNTHMYSLKTTKANIELAVRDMSQIHDMEDSNLIEYAISSVLEPDPHLPDGQPGQFRHYHSSVNPSPFWFFRIGKQDTGKIFYHTDYDTLKFTKDDMTTTFMQHTLVPDMYIAYTDGNAFPSCGVDRDMLINHFADSYWAEFSDSFLGGSLRSATFIKAAIYFECIIFNGRNCQTITVDYAEQPGDQILMAIPHFNSSIVV